MPFSEIQTNALAAKLNRKHVRTRKDVGKTLSYIEGWHAIAEANRIFGFGGWSRETLESNCVWQGTKQGRPACSYIARVRISVVSDGQRIVRDGSGAGQGQAACLGDAHEHALKEAETDATKRALVTFGNPFGLALYDREQRGVRGRRRKPKQVMTWRLSLGDGKAHEVFGDAVDFYAALRRALEATPTREAAQALFLENLDCLMQLRLMAPDLVNTCGQHYSEIIERLYAEHRQSLHDPQNGAGSLQKDGISIDKSKLVIGVPRRIRDKNHLSNVARQPCLVCGRKPSQAHHLTHMQPKAMGRKSSDEWTVPLCATHHRQLHDASRCCCFG